MLDHLTNEQFLFDIFRYLQIAVEKGVQLFIDAERHNIQPAIKLMAVATMLKYNKDKPWVWSTYQAYLKVRFLKLIIY